MAKLFKEVGNSISATLGATTAVTQSIANVAVTIANAASTTVEPTVGMVSDMATLGRMTTSAMLEDARNDELIDIEARKAKVTASKAVLAKDETKAKLQERAEADVLERLFD